MLSKNKASYARNKNNQAPSAFFNEGIPTLPNKLDSGIRKSIKFVSKEVSVLDNGNKKKNFFFFFFN